MLFTNPRLKLPGIALVAGLCVPLLFGAVFGAPAKPKILVFTKTQGFDHGTRKVADSLIQLLGAKNGFDVDTTNDTGTYFKDAKLMTYKAVCFINVTGNVFNDSTKAAFQRYFKAGGGWVGMHSAVDCEYTWHWYHEMAGAYFANHHFGIAPAKLAVLSHANPSTSWIAKDTITRSDEWYFFTPQTYDSNIDPAKLTNLTVLINLVESSIPNSTEKKFHPMCWCQEFQGGRAWYSGFGHAPEYFRDTVVQKNLLGGILWAAHLSPTPVLPENPKATITIAPASGEITIYDLFGRKIRTLRADGQAWNRTDECGKPVATGRYYLVQKRNGATPAATLLFVK
jgi:cytochrome c